MIEKDYIMRLIHEVIRTLIRLIFHIDINKWDDSMYGDKQRQERFRKLADLIDQGRIDEAENQLLDGLNAVDMKDYELALRFYGYLNEKDGDFLEAHDFSRGEIVEGLKLLGKMFGYRSMTESLLEDIEIDD